MKKCPICKSSVSESFQKQHFVIYRCADCGFGFTENSNLQKGEYHRDEEYIEEEKLFRNIFQKRVNLISRISKPGKVLEIGCSTGILLSLLKQKGWDVSGVELSNKAAEVAEKRGVNVSVCPFEDFQTKEKYNLVILNHVLEHLEKPEAILKKIYSLLVPRGRVLISLPNFYSLSARWQKANWPLLLPEEHLWHFTPKSLSLMLEKLNFKVIYFEATSGIWDYGNPWLGMLGSLIGLKKRFFVELLTAIPAFVLTKINRGSGLIIIAQKK